MALISQCRWGTVVFLAMAIPCAARVEQEELGELAEAAPFARAGRGRFLANFDEALPVSSRRHLNALISAFNRCSGQGYSNCNEFPLKSLWKIPACCQDLSGNSFCTDISTPLRCGSCTTSCALGEECCDGVCSNPISDPKNCGKCGKVCPAGQPCTFFLCGY